VGAIRQLLGYAQVANIGGSLPLGIFDKWQNHFFLFGIYPLVIGDFIFPFFLFSFFNYFYFFFSPKGGGNISYLVKESLFFFFLI